MREKRLSLNTWLILMLILLSASSFGDTRKILVLNAYHDGYYWSDRIMEGITSILTPETDTELFINYMDTKHCFDENYFSTLRNLYAHKYSQQDFDLILSNDDYALDFLLQYREELFPGIPVVFCGINDYSPDRIEGHTKYTGISETYDIAGTVETMLQLHPETVQINFIIDNTLTGHYFNELIKRDEPKFEGRVKFNYLINRDIESLKTALANQSPTDLAVWASYLRTPDGQTLSCKNGLRLVTENSKRPVYAIWDVIGLGDVVGGKITSPILQGKFIAKQALRILNGEKIEDMPVIKSELVHIFDDRMLKQFKIPQANLPNNSIILHEPYSIYREYRGVIWLTACFFIILCAIIAALTLDILKRKKAEEALKKSEAKLRQTEKLGALGQLAGGIAHDFNNQLAGVVGYADLMLEELKDKTLRSFALGIKKSALRSAELTSQLLAFSRRGKFLSVSVDVHDLVNDVSSMLKHSIDKRIKIVTTLNAQTSLVRADPNQLQNAILNMALNARDAMPNGGKLSLVTENAVFETDFSFDHEYEIPAGRYISITVKDTGSGMNEETQKHIFEPFFTTKPIGKGTGMGLASAYGTVKNHQGIITVQSEPKAGTNICIYLPLIDKQEKATPEALLEQSQTPEIGHILLVDDEPIILDMGKRMLSKLGYSVDICCNGYEALEFYKIHHDRIDLVILDMMMPELNGRETFTALLKINPKIKVILSSGYSLDGEAQDLMDLGVIDFIAKPYSKDHLASVLKKALSSLPSENSPAKPI